MKWITRERPKIDRIACPWRFIDRSPDFLFVPAGEVLRVVEATRGVPYDIPGVELSHVGGRCSIDVFVDRYSLTGQALHRLALIVRAADTDRLDLAAELLAISRPVSSNFSNDHEMLQHGLLIYDALYTWCGRYANATSAARTAS